MKKISIEKQLELQKNKEILIDGQIKKRPSGCGGCEDASKKLKELKAKKLQNTREP